MTKIEPVACYAAHRGTPAGTTEFFGYADKPLEPATMFYTEAQMRQLGEACAVAAWSAGMSLHKGQPNARDIGSKCAAEIRALIKEMLG